MMTKNFWGGVISPFMKILSTNERLCFVRLFSQYSLWDCRLPIVGPLCAIKKSSPSEGLIFPLGLVRQYLCTKCLRGFMDGFSLYAPHMPCQQSWFVCVATFISQILYCGRVAALRFSGYYGNLLLWCFTHFSNTLPRILHHQRKWHNIQCSISLT